MAVFGKIARECGLEWGGDFKTYIDRPHVQWTRGKTLSQMRGRPERRRAETSSSFSHGGLISWGCER